MNFRTSILAMSILAASPLACASGNHFLTPQWTEVSGSGVHRFSSALVHSAIELPSGLVQRSTEIVELSGDLSGLILYHPISHFDFAAGTLITTGQQVFSGTVLDFGPVLLHDDEYRFEVNLGTGQVVGKVFLENRLSGRDIRCHLDVSGQGETDALGDALFGYTGSCRFRQLPSHISETPIP